MVNKMIRIAKQQDLADIVNIYNESIPGRMATADTRPILIESRLAWFDKHTYQRPLWIHEKNNEITGWLGLQSFYDRPAYQETVEMSVYIKNKFKQQGIAKNLMVHMLEECPKLNIKTILSFVFSHNIPSINLILHFGFQQWGHLPKVALLDNLEKDVVIYGLRIKF